MITKKDIDLIATEMDCCLDLTLNGNWASRDENSFNYDRYPYNENKKNYGETETHGEYCKRASKVLLKLWKIQEIIELEKTKDIPASYINIPIMIKEFGHE